MRSNNDMRSVRNANGVIETMTVTVRRFLAAATAP
jgi:hypothetical protein